MTTPPTLEGRPALAGQNGVLIECRPGRTDRLGPSWAGWTAPTPAPTVSGPGFADALSTDFTIRLIAGGDFTVLVVSGELTMLTAAAFGSFLDAAASQAGQLVVIDVAAVTFISSSALAQLARILPRLRSVGSELAIMSPSRMVYKVLDLTGFTTQTYVEQPTR